MPIGLSLHIGLNKVDPKKYGGWDGELIACEHDANDMAQLAKQAKFQDFTTLLTAEATVKNVTGALREAAKELSSGDILFLTYSGHGGQVPDINGPEDEPDRLDETWVLYDRELIDDELYKEFEGFADGVRIVVLSDSCHSGSVVSDVAETLSPQALESQFHTNGRKSRKQIEKVVEERSRVMPLAKQDEIHKRDKKFFEKIQRNLDAKDAREIGASVLLISGCMDNQLSADGPRNGLFTGTLLDVWDNGKNSQGGYRAFHRRIQKKMPPNQTPHLFVTGRPNERFLRQRPFTV